MSEPQTFGGYHPDGTPCPAGALRSSIETEISNAIDQGDLGWAARSPGTFACVMAVAAMWYPEWTVAIARHLEEHAVAMGGDQLERLRARVDAFVRSVPIVANTSRAGEASRE